MDSRKHFISGAVALTCLGEPSEVGAPASVLVDGLGRIVAPERINVDVVEAPLCLQARGCEGGGLCQNVCGVEPLVPVVLAVGLGEGREVPRGPPAEGPEVGRHELSRGQQRQLDQLLQRYRGQERWR